MSTPNPYGKKRRTRCKVCRTLSYHVFYGVCRPCREEGKRPSDAPPREGQTITRRFDSVNALIDYVSTPSESTTGGTYEEQSKDPECEWNGNIPFDTACAMARDGWADVRDEVMAAVATIDGELREVVVEDLTPLFDVVGGEVDVSLMMAGEPENMRDYVMREGSASREVVSILVSTCTNAGTDADTIRRRGAAVCAIVELVARANLSVEVVTSDDVVHGSDRIVSRTIVKHAADRIDIDSIMFPIAHPAWLRRITFGVLEHESKRTRDTFRIHHYGQYGSAVDPLPDPETTLVIPSLSHRDRVHFRDTASTVEWVREQLRTLRVLEGGDNHV